MALSWTNTAQKFSMVRTLNGSLIATGYSLVWASVVKIIELLGPDSDNLFEPKTDRRLEDLSVWIDAHLGEDLSLSTLSKQTGCGEGELNFWFRESLGTTPARWIRNKRISLAMELLSNTKWPLEHIAERCGFADRTRLTKVFSKVQKISPSAYRNRQKIVLPLTDRIDLRIN